MKTLQDFIIKKTFVQYGSFAGKENITIFHVESEEEFAILFYLLSDDFIECTEYETIMKIKYNSKEKLYCLNDDLLLTSLRGYIKNVKSYLYNKEDITKLEKFLANYK